MKSVKQILFLAVISLIAFSTKASAENVPTKIYAYGFCQSFNDSTVYFTDIQEIDSAWVDSKTKFLYSRDNYAYQMRDYMQQVEGEKYPVCNIIFATKLKDVTKKYDKMKAKYQKSKYNYLVKSIDSSYFKFEAIKFADEYVPMTKAERKAAKKAAKEERKRNKASKKDGRAPGGMPPGGQGGPGGGPGGMPGGGGPGGGFGGQGGPGGMPGGGGFGGQM